MGDMIWKMLDEPAFQDMENFSSQITYITPSFDPAVYSKSRNKSFASDIEAYGDWREFGRRQGLEYAHNKDTLLKIILKIKDEVDLLDKWVEYYSALIGPHNIIIMNCGSQDSCFIKKLAGLRSRLIVLDYHKYFLGVHFYSGNKRFYDEIASSCKFLAVLDADEFLFGLKDTEISPLYVKEILRESELIALPGTWFNALPQQLNLKGSIDWDRPLTLDVSPSAIAGLSSFAGKVVVRSDSIARAENIGHNMHALSVVRMLEPHHFLALGIIHLACLPEEIVRKRTLSHLITRQIVPANSMTRTQLIDHLAAKLIDPLTEARAKEYIRRYLDPRAAVGVPSATWQTNILSDYRPERQKVGALRSPQFYSQVAHELNKSLERLNRAVTH